MSEVAEGREPVEPAEGELHDEGAGPEPGHEDDEPSDEQLAPADPELPF